MRVLVCCWLGMLVAGVAAETARDAVLPYEDTSFSVPQSRIDELVFARLAKEKVAVAKPCSDVVFLRRVFVDLTGTLPTPDEVTAFLTDRSLDKRKRVVDSLFKRREFDDYWTMRLAELFRVKAEFPINLWPNPAQGYHGFLRESVRVNEPVDHLARRLITATGSNMRVPESNFMRAVQNREPRSLAAAAALSFMGVRRESWTAPELDALSVFFSRVGYKPTSEWKEEIVYFDETKPAHNGSVLMPDGKKVVIPPDADPRTVFAGWLTAKDNPWFARCWANRAWFWLMGRGIIHEPDDIRRDNPPSNPELLAYLAKDFAAHGYDLRHLLKEIVNSRIYQLSFIPAAGSGAEEKFACHAVRRMEAEVLIDALCAVTGTFETYSSLIPEPYSFLPEGTRAIELPDGSISSPFLELFGRPSRDAGLVAERNGNPSSGQRLHFLNSSHVRNKIERGGMLRGLPRAGRPEASVGQLWLAILSRPPTPGEMKTACDFITGTPDRRSAWADLTWALFNTTEFQCRH